MTVGSRSRSPKPIFVLDFKKLLLARESVKIWTTAACYVTVDELEVGMSWKLDMSWQSLTTLANFSTVNLPIRWTKEDANSHDVSRSADDMGSTAVCDVFVIDMNLFDDRVYTVLLRSL